VPAAVRFVSAEPLLGPVEGLDLEGLHWVIAGGESGPGARPLDLDWVWGLRDRCVQAQVRSSSSRSVVVRPRCTDSGRCSDERRRCRHCTRLTARPEER
jgi:protein gp37